MALCQLHRQSSLSFLAGVGKGVIWVCLGKWVFWLWLWDSDHVVGSLTPAFFAVLVSDDANLLAGMIGADRANGVPTHGGTLLRRWDVLMIGSESIGSTLVLNRVAGANIDSFAFDTGFLGIGNTQDGNIDVRS